MTTANGEPVDDVAPVERQDDPDAVVGHLIEIETEAVNRLQDAIVPTGREGRLEAIEHRLEYMIMRKQEAIDFLLRARRRR